MTIFPKFNMKMVRTWVLILAILTQLTPVIFFVTGLAYNKYIQPKIIKATYVGEIKGDPIEQAMIKDALVYFNNFGEGKIVKFEKPNSRFARPIEFSIHDFRKDIFLNNLAGLTTINGNNCKIQVYPTSDPVEFKQVLIHEYLHCMGYNHVDKQSDLMYPSYIEVKESNIQKYADELKAKME